jgi:hypothetical protein
MISRRILVLALIGLVVMATINCQPRTYHVSVTLSQPDGRPPVSSGLVRSGERITTFSGAPLFVEFSASGYDCPNQDLSFMITYLYRKVRPTNFLEDPSLYVMEGYMLTTTIVSDTCSGNWTSPTLRDGIHTIGIIGYDGSGAQNTPFYVTIIKNNERDNEISYFPGGSQSDAEKDEEPPISSEPSVIIDTPDQNIKSGSNPVQYVDIHFHTNYPFLVEYFFVEWTFTSQGGCTFSSYSIVYPTEANEGFYRLDMSSVFASAWDRPQGTDGRCTFGPGEFEVKISCKTAYGIGNPSTVTINIS